MAGFDDGDELPPNRTAALALFVICSLRNAAGQRMGDAVEGGVEGVLGHLAVLLVYGGYGPTAPPSHVAAAAAAATAAASSSTPAPQPCPAHEELNTVIGNVTLRNDDAAVVSLIAQLQVLLEMALSAAITGVSGPQHHLAAQQLLEAAKDRAVSGVGIAAVPPPVDVPGPRSHQGALVPLDCGHNGPWGPHSRQMLLQHLTALGLMSTDVLNRLLPAFATAGTADAAYASDLCESDLESGSGDAGHAGSDGYAAEEVVADASHGHPGHGSRHRGAM